MRKLATIRRIKEINPIPDADAIEVAKVDGWNVVVKKGEFAVGELVVYLEIDSWVPTELAPFLSKGKEPKEYNGVKGERLRTVRLRGQISQGLILPIDLVNDTPFIAGWYHEDGIETMVMIAEGQDVTESMNIQKWEAPIPAQLAGLSRGNFPSHLVPKTDQERVQNCFDEILRDGYTYEKTIKLDGSSCTVLRSEGELRVCSRNLELKIEENDGNTFVRVANKIGDRIPDGYAVQGEVIGPGIQGNREGLKDIEFYVFDVFNISEHRYLSPSERRIFCELHGFDHVPVVEHYAVAPESVEDALEQAEGPSLNNKVREGIVWKCNEDPTFSFKAISNKFLLNGGD